MAKARVLLNFHVDAAGGRGHVDLQILCGENVVPVKADAACGTLEGEIP